MYANAGEVPEERIMDATRIMAESKTRAVLVVDRCHPKTHDVLKGMALHPRSLLSLITIDSDRPRNLPDDTVEVGVAADSVIEAILNHRSPGLVPEDRRRIVRFVQGFPGLAARVGEIHDIADVVKGTDDHMVDAFIVGHGAPKPGATVEVGEALGGVRNVRKGSGGRHRRNGRPPRGNPGREHP